MFISIKWYLARIALIGHVSGDISHVSSTLIT